MAAYRVSGSPHRLVAGLAMISSDGRPEIKRDFSSSVEFYSIKALRRECGV
jgi:hypothetical protein